ncbi:MAG: hypothetical protein SOW55_00515 [Bacilli bacterium]|nr:hypothetical protein [Bacilli bacterium]
MRRFAGYIATVITLICTVLFCTPLQVSSLKSGLEYGTGYEAVYQIDFEESTKTIEDIVEILTNRIEDAGVRNANIESVSDVDTNGDNHQVRIQTNAQTEDDFEYVLRSLEATGTITVSGVMDEGDYIEITDPFVIGSAKVEYSGSTPYVQVDVKDYDKFNNFITSCNNAYEEFKNKYLEDSEDSSKIDGVVVIWLDKTEADSYVDAFENENKVIQEKIKEKILSIVPTSYFKVEKDLNDKVTTASLLIDRYDFDQIQMVSDSAHTIERLLNYEPQDYSLRRLYVQKVNATFGNNSFNIVLIGVSVLTLLACIFLIVRYGLAGLCGASAFLVSNLLSIVVFNFFGYPLTTMVVVSFLIIMALNLALIVPLLENFKDELYKGKSPIKANSEAFKSTRILSLDVLVCSLISSIITILISINQVKLLPITLTIGAIASYVVTRLLMMLTMWWLTSSKVAENRKIFMVKDKDLISANKDETQKKFNFMYKFNPNREGKKVSLIALIASAVSVVVILVTSLIPGVGTLNYTSEFDSTTRVEITAEVSGNTHVFDTKDEVNEFFQNEFDLTPTMISINKVENVVLDPQNRDDLPTMAYISIEFDSQGIDYDTFYDTLEEKFFNLEEVQGENVELFVATTKSTMPTYILTYSAITLVMFGLLSGIYFTIRYRFSYGISSLSTIIPAGLVAVALFSIARIPTSPLLLMGIASGLLIASISQIPLLARFKKLTRESKTKVATFEQRKEIILRGNKESLSSVITISSVACGLIIVGAFFIPLDLVSVFGGMLVSLVLATLLTCFLFTPICLKLEEKYYSYRAKRMTKVLTKKKEKGKKRLNKIKEAHRNVGSEPEESIIPGIND